MKLLKSVKKILKQFGPGFVTGASDDDPAGIATYAQTGAIFGYQQLWVAPFSFPFMTAVQEMSGRIGIVTGRGLAATIRQHYPRPILTFVVTSLLVANIFNIGANLGAMASSLRLLVDVPFVAILLGITVLTIALQVFVPYRYYVNILKYLALSLMAYVATAFFVQQDWGAITRATLVPTFVWDKAFILNLTAILGTTISPYLFFWQASQEVEEEVKNKQLKRMNWGRPAMSIRNIQKMRKDTLVGMFFSNMVMFFIIITAASTLHTAGITDIATADQAASALEPFAGQFASLLFAAGIVGTGLLAIPVLAGSASYAIAETFKWREGLSLQARQAPGFYAIITVATAVGLLINFLHLPVFHILYYSAVLNGIVAPPVIAIMMHIANNRDIMGHYVNSRTSNIFGTIIVLIMTGCALALGLSLL